MRLVVVVAAGLALCCSRSKQTDSSAAKPAVSVPAAAPSAPAPAASLAPAPAPEAAPSARHSASGEGLSVIENSDGTVILKGKSTFNEALDTTYENCDFFTKAIPVLKRQLTEQQAKLLGEVCKKP